jgi:Na+-transporting NADH:ubiquinone oxidoreductase subunit A
MTTVITLKKGLDIRLAGKAKEEVHSAGIVGEISIVPDDYQGFTPKVMVKQGDQVLAGTPVLYDKLHPEVVLVSPVSGIVEAVVRGEKRKLLGVKIRPDNKGQFVEFAKQNPNDLSSTEILGRICTAGLFSYIHQRPYDVVANPLVVPRDIFVTGFDTAPLAADVAYLLRGQGESFQAGLNALALLTQGKVYLSIPADQPCKELTEAKNVEIFHFRGAHPAGNVGVQINRIKPVNKGETVWTLRAVDVLFIGRLFRLGKVDLSLPVAVCGPGVRQPCYIMALPGIPVASLLNGNQYLEMHARIVSGNPLTGKTVAQDGYLSASSTSLTVLKEGNDIHEFFGWIMPRMDKFSMSGTYLSRFIGKLFPAIRYEPDTRLLGGRRALIVSGEYEKVFPMDILPEKLLRACLTGNIEKQENLGIYEVAPEDFSLCEYVCTSKIEIQKTIREALDLLHVENGD